MLSSAHRSLIVWLTGASLCAQEPLIRVDIWEYPAVISAPRIRTWTEEGQPRVFLAEAGFQWRQGELRLDADRGAMWFDETLAAETGEVALDIYVEGRVSVMQGKDVARYERVLVRASSSGSGAGLVIRPNPVEIETRPKNAFLVRGEKLRADTFADFASKKAVLPVRAAGVPDIEEVSISMAGPLDGWLKGEKETVAVFRDDVVFKMRDVTLTADYAVLWLAEGSDAKGGASGEKLKLKEFYAEGNVTLRRGKDVITADRAYENVHEERGVYINARLALKSVDPGIYFSAPEVWHTGKGQYEAADGSFSTCDHAAPHYDVKSRFVRVNKTAESTIVSATHNFLRIGGVPFLYWPYVSHDIEDRDFILREFRAGSSSDMGHYVETRWNAHKMVGHKSQWSELDLMVDHYSKRGTGLGLDFDYGVQSMQGSAMGYYISDSEDEDRPGEPIEDSDRGRFLWRHRSYLPRDLRLEAEVSYLSDRTFLREFFEDEFQEGKEQETVLYLRKLHENQGFRYQQKHRINHFDTTVEQLPALTYDVIGEPFWGNTLVYTSTTELANLHRNVDNELRVQNPERTWRFHTGHELALPFKVWMVRMSPFYRAELTAADHGRTGRLAPRPKRHRSRRRGATTVAARRADEAALIGGDSSSAVYRVAPTLGLNASTDLWRIYNVHSDLLDVNRMRHIMTPEIQWEVTPSISNDEPRDFNQFDEVDRIDEFHRLMLGYRNRFQTKRGKPGKERSIDFMTFDVEYSVYPGNRGLNAEFDDLVELDFTYLIRNWLTYVSKGNELNLGTGNFEVLSNGLKVRPSKRWSVYLGHEFIHRTNSALTFDLEHVINDRWTVRLYEQYDFNNKVDRDRGRENLETALTLRRLLHKWAMDVTLEFDEGEDDTRVSLAFAHVGSERRLRRY